MRIHLLQFLWGGGGFAGQDFRWQELTCWIGHTNWVAVSHVACKPQHIFKDCVHDWQILSWLLLQPVWNNASSCNPGLDQWTDWLMQSCLSLGLRKVSRDSSSCVWLTILLWLYRELVNHGGLRFEALAPLHPQVQWWLNHCHSH